MFGNFALAALIIGVVTGIFDGILSNGFGIERIFELLSHNSMRGQELLGATGSVDPIVAKAKLTQFIDQLDTGI